MPRSELETRISGDLEVSSVEQMTRSCGQLETRLYPTHQPKRIEPEILNDA